MCTLTFTGPALRAPKRGAPQVAEHAGYQVWFNRDERVERGDEIPPAEARTPSGVRYLAPTDSDAGGTWIAVNEFGVTVALLNGFTVSKGPTRSHYTSRGVLVRSLAGLKHLPELWARLSPAELAPFRPAVVCLLFPGQRPVVARWDGRDVEVDLDGTGQLPLTSSSYEQDDVRTYRRDLYQERVTTRAKGGAARPQDLEEFHAYVTPKGPTAMTPSMSREDSATRSHCAIDVRPGNIRFAYQPGPPHGTEPVSVINLRSPHAAPGRLAVDSPRAPHGER